MANLHFLFGAGLSVRPSLFQPETGNRHLEQFEPQRHGSHSQGKSDCGIVASAKAPFQRGVDLIGQMAKHGYYTTPHWKALRRAALARDGYRCTVPGCRARATHVDHIVTRPPVGFPTQEDRLDNLRSLCASPDLQIKELRSGQRRRDGRLVVKGCDADGWPLAKNFG